MILVEIVRAKIALVARQPEVQEAHSKGVLEENGWEMSLRVFGSGDMWIHWADAICDSNSKHDFS